MVQHSGANETIIVFFGGGIMDTALGDKKDLPEIKRKIYQMMINGKTCAGLHWCPFPKHVLHCPLDGEKPDDKVLCELWTK
jgi:hypothetical protein